MFYSADILCPGKTGNLSVLWLVATGCFQYERRQDKHFSDVIKVNVSKSCAQILRHIKEQKMDEKGRPVHFSLYLSSMLMCGVVKIHHRQVLLLYDDAVESRVRLSHVLRSGIDLPYASDSSNIRLPPGSCWPEYDNVLMGTLPMTFYEGLGWDVGRDGLTSPRKRAADTNGVTGSAKKSRLETETLREHSDEPPSAATAVSGLQTLLHDWEDLPTQQPIGPHSVAHIDDITLREVDTRRSPVTLPPPMDFGPPFSELPDDFLKAALPADAPSTADFQTPARATKDKPLVSKRLGEKPAAEAHAEEALGEIPQVTVEDLPQQAARPMESTPLPPPPPPALPPAPAAPAKLPPKKGQQGPLEITPKAPTFAVPQPPASRRSLRLDSSKLQLPPLEHQPAAVTAASPARRRRRRGPIIDVVNYISKKDLRIQSETSADTLRAACAADVRVNVFLKTTLIPGETLLRSLHHHYHHSHMPRKQYRMPFSNVILPLPFHQLLHNLPICTGRSLGRLITRHYEASEEFERFNPRLPPPRRAIERGFHDTLERADRSRDDTSLSVGASLQLSKHGSSLRTPDASARSLLSSGSLLAEPLTSGPQPGPRAALPLQPISEEHDVGIAHAKAVGPGSEREPPLPIPEAEDEITPAPPQPMETPVPSEQRSPPVGDTVTMQLEADVAMPPPPPEGYYALATSDSPHYIRRRTRFSPDEGLTKLTVAADVHMPHTEAQPRLPALAHGELDSDLAEPLTKRRRPDVSPAAATTPGIIPDTPRGTIPTGPDVAPAFVGAEEEVTAAQYPSFVPDIVTPIRAGPASPARSPPSISASRRAELLWRRLKPSRREEVESGEELGEKEGREEKKRKEEEEEEEEESTTLEGLLSNSPTRREVAVTLITLLELHKQRKVFLTQDFNYGPVYVTILATSPF